MGGDYQFPEERGYLAQGPYSFWHLERIPSENLHFFECVSMGWVIFLEKGPSQRRGVLAPNKGWSREGSGMAGLNNQGRAL